MNDAAASPLVSRRTLVRIAAWVVALAVVIGAPLVHYLAWKDAADARLLRDHGHDVVITSPSDVRVTTTRHRWGLDVTGVGVRVDGVWRALPGAGESQPSGVDRWYPGEGQFMPLSGTALAPPLALRVADDASVLKRESDYRTDLRAGSPGWGFWIADLVAAAVLVGAMRRLWGYSLSGTQDGRDGKE